MSKHQEIMKNLKAVNLQEDLYPDSDAKKILSNLQKVQSLSTQATIALREYNSKCHDILMVMRETQELKDKYAEEMVFDIKSVLDKNVSKIHEGIRDGGNLSNSMSSFTALISNCIEKYWKVAVKRL